MLFFLRLVNCEIEVAFVDKYGFISSTRNLISSFYEVMLTVPDGNVSRRSFFRVKAFL